MQSLLFLVAAVGGIIIYLYNPASRLEKQLSFGCQYLKEQKYEEAEEAFEKVIVIDNKCIEGYFGLIKVYEEIGEAEELEEFYEDVLDILEDLEEDNIADVMDYAVWIYGKAEDIYGVENGRYIKVLEKGYEITQKDKYIQEALV